MISATLILKKSAQGEWQGLGVHEFVALPRIGEHIELFEDERTNFLYQVVSIHHLLKAHTNAVDIYAVRVGTKLDVLSRLSL